MDLIIEGHPAELEWLRREIVAELGADADVESETAGNPIELSEPLIISLIVALGGPVVMRKIADVLKRRYEHLEAIAVIEKELRLKELENTHELTKLKLKQVDDNGDEHLLTEAQFAASAANP